MKSRSFLVFILILSLAIIPSLQLALAASSSSTTTSTTSTSTSPKVPTYPFSQRLDIYTVGSNDYFLINLSPVNATKPALITAESVAGMSAFELTVIKSTGAAPSSQLFWAGGYKVLKVPFVPDQGVFLNVTADSQSSAQAAATDFNTFVGTNLIQIGSSGNNYTFFAPVDFGIAGNAVFASVPAVEKGLASMFTAATLLNQPTPTAILTGVRSGSSFTNAVTIGSTETHAVASNGTLSLAKVWNLANGTFTSSLNATSTKVVVHSLDGLISSPDAATIVNHQANFSARYSMVVSKNTTYSPNIKIVSDPPVLTATRTVNKGSAVSGDLVQVTLNLRNTAGKNTTVQNIAVNDNWWTSYPSLFSLTAGNSTVSIPELAGGQNASEVYVLKVTSSASENLVVPDAAVSYSYGVGNVTVHSSTQTNQVEIRANDAGPALQIQAGANIPSGSPIGTLGSYVVTVTNLGDGPALDLKVGSFADQTLQAGQVWQFNTTLPLNTIVGRNTTQTFTLRWTAPDGTQGTLVSNPATLVLSHSGILIPLMQFQLSATPNNAVIALGAVNATYILSNTGSAAPANVTVAQSFPTGMVCKSAIVNANSNGTATCNSSGFSLFTQSVAPGSTVSGTIILTFSRDNYLAEPAVVTTTDSGLTLITQGTGFVIPAGVNVQKTYSSSQLFLGMNDTVTVKVTNLGSLPILNVSAVAEPDNFDTTTSGSLTMDYPFLSPGSSQTYNFTVHTFIPGNQSAAAASVSYDFGGFQEAYTAPTGYVSIYRDVHATTLTKPTSPVEGSDFSLTVTVVNPAPVNVTNVSVSMPIPRGLTIVNYSAGLVLTGSTITFSVPSLAGGATSSHLITLRAGTDGTVNFATGTLKFDYLGTTVAGSTSNTSIVVGVDLLIRYELPIGLAVIIAVAVAFYMHRKLPAPQAK